MPWEGRKHLTRVCLMSWQMAMKQLDVWLDNPASLSPVTQP